MFLNDLEDWRTIPGQVISKTKKKKKYLIPPPCLTFSVIRYVSRVKWSNPGKGVAPFPTPWCSSYWKGSLWVTLDYDHQLYFFYIAITDWALSKLYCIWFTTNLWSEIVTTYIYIYTHTHTYIQTHTVWARCDKAFFFKAEFNRFFF